MDKKRLGDIATYINGYAFKPEDRGIEGLPIIRIQDLTGNGYDLGFFNGEYPDKIEINDGDVLISWSASLGVYVWNRGKALLNQHIFKVVFDKEEVDKKYFVFAVKYNLKEMVSKTHGATMKHIVKKDFENTMVPFPTIQKQKEIANVLSKVSTIIQSRQQELQKLDELVKARFVEMFGDIKTNSMGWKRVKLRDVADVRGRVGWKGYKKEDLRDEGPLVLGATHLTDNGKIDLSAPVYLSREKYEESPEIVLQKGDLIFTQRGNTIGKVGLVEDEIGEATINPCVLILRPIRIHPVYFKSYFVMDETKDDMWILNSGSAQPMITQKGIGEYVMMLPPIELQNQFASFVKQIDKHKLTKVHNHIY